MKKINIDDIKSQVCCGNLMFYVDKENIYLKDTTSLEVVKVGAANILDEIKIKREIADVYSKMYNQESEDIDRTVAYLKMLIDKKE